MDATVFKRKVKGPATHAIVIGVGHYPYLQGGGRKQFRGSPGMGQLKSPPPSARAMARWLVEEYEHPDKPLASLSLLVSDAADSAFEFRVGKKLKSVAAAPATMPEVDAAVRAWRKAGHRNPDHLMLFFFCGHGIAHGPYLSLLLSDFGANPEAPLYGAVDFRRLWLGMDECAAREQCYFVDACRVGSELLARSEGFAGLPIIQNVAGATNVTGRLRQAPVFHSTLSGGQAYAKSGEPSLYTKALLEALAGAGCDVDEDGKWRVHTNQLNGALGSIMLDASKRLRVSQLQIPPAEGLTTFNLNVVASPLVPVIVTCRPDTFNDKATLSCRNGSLQRMRKPGKETWRLKLPVDTYDFVARIDTLNYSRPKVEVRPPFPRVNLDIKE